MLTLALLTLALLTLALLTLALLTLALLALALLTLALLTLTLLALTLLTLALLTLSLLALALLTLALALLTLTLLTLALLTLALLALALLALALLALALLALALLTLALLTLALLTLALLTLTLLTLTLLALALLALTLLLPGCGVVGGVLVLAVGAEVGLHVLDLAELEVALIDLVAVLAGLAERVRARLLDRVHHVPHELELLAHVGHVLERRLRGLEPLEGCARVGVLHALRRLLQRLRQLGVALHVLAQLAQLLAELLHATGDRALLHGLRQALRVSRSALEVAATERVAHALRGVLRVAGAVRLLEGGDVGLHVLELLAHRGQAAHGVLAVALAGADIGRDPVQLLEQLVELSGARLAELPAQDLGGLADPIGLLAADLIGPAAAALHLLAAEQLEGRHEHHDRGGHGQGHRQPLEAARGAEGDDLGGVEGLDPRGRVGDQRGLGGLARLTDRQGARDPLVELELAVDPHRGVQLGRARAQGADQRDQHGAEPGAERAPPPGPVQGEDLQGQRPQDHGAGRPQEAAAESIPQGHEEHALGDARHSGLDLCHRGLLDEYSQAMSLSPPLSGRCKIGFRLTRAATEIM
ncbi:MAG: hypothetical protein R3F62_04560 [Planctomycetota bacterium]